MEGLITFKHRSIESSRSLKKIIWISTSLKEVPKPKGYEAKVSHKRRIDKDEKIIAYSIKDHLIPPIPAIYWFDLLSF